MDKQKAELVKAIKASGLAPDEELVIENQETIDDLVKALRFVATILEEVKQPAGYRLIGHTNFVARVNLKQQGE